MTKAKTKKATPATLAARIKRVMRDYWVPLLLLFVCGLVAGAIMVDMAR